MLIKTNKELREHLGGAVSMSLTAVEGEQEDNRILAYVAGAELKYIRKAIGPEMLSQLQAEYDAGAVSAGNLALFKLLQRASAFYAYAEWSAFSAASDGNNGLEADEKKNPKMWQVLERINKSYELASDSIEEALKVLFTGDFPVFKTSDIWQSTYGLLVNSGDVLHKALPASSGSYRIFVTLWPYLLDVEKRECEEVAGATTYQLLKTKRNGTGWPLDPLQLEARQLMEKLTAHAAYLSALPEIFTVSADGGGLRVFSEFDGIRNKNTPNSDQMARLIGSFEKKVQGYRAELKAHLDNNVSAFTGYGTERYRGGSKPGFMKNEKNSPVFRL